MQVVSQARLNRKRLLDELDKVVFPWSIAHQKELGCQLLAIGTHKCLIGKTLHLKYVRYRILNEPPLAAIVLFNIHQDDNVALQLGHLPAELLRDDQQPDRAF